MDGKEIEAAADALLQAARVSYAATLVQRGAKDDSGWEHDAWRIEFRASGNRKLEQSFKTGTGHRTPAPMPNDGGGRPRVGTLMHESLEAQRKPIPPKAASVLSSLVSDDPHGESFESWAENLGYDSDSRKALAIYMECQRQTDAAKRFFGSDVWASIVATVEGY